MGSIMRKPSPINAVTIPLNGRTLQDGDCIVVICPSNSECNALAVYQEGSSWEKTGDPNYNYSTTPSGDSVRVEVTFDLVPNHYYACFLPSPIPS